MDYCTFREESTGSLYQKVTQQEIRDLMQERVSIDKTLEDTVGFSARDDLVSVSSPPMPLY